MTVNEKQDLPFDPALPGDITVLLQNNKHLSDVDRVKEVIAMLEKRANFTALLYYAAMYFIQNEKFNDYGVGLGLITLNTVLSTENRVKANEADTKKRTLVKINKIRVDKYAVIEEQLKLYWQENIAPDKPATEAAILLEKTGICENAIPKLKRSTLEKYARKWQAKKK
jgi:hypothetical protein